MKKLMTAAAMMLAATAAATATEVVIIRGSSNSECVVADPTGTPLNGCGSDPGHHSALSSLLASARSAVS